MALCFPSQVSKFPWQQDEIAAIWRAAKEDYIDKGFSWEDTVTGLANDFAARPEHIVQAMASPKVLRHISNDVWKTQERRRSMLQNARAVVENFDKPGLSKALDRIFNIPRSALTAYHGAVFPNSHMGSFLFNPDRWSTYFGANVNAWKFLSGKQYKIAELRHLSDPYYDFARRASRSVDLSQESVGILNTMHGWSGKGFNTLKIARLDLFKREFKQNITAAERADIENRRPLSQDTEAKLNELAKPLMNRIDAATGEFGLGKAGKAISYILFAPKLVPARIKAAMVDPARSVGTAMNWSKASAGDRAAAKFVMKNAVNTLATYAAGLALNEGILQHSNSDDHINFSNPAQGDWLSFKIGGLSIRPPNAYIEILRLIGGMIYPFFADEKQLRGAAPEAAASDNLADYARYKLHPTIRLGSELLSGVDLFNRPLPQLPESLGGHQLGLRPALMDDKESTDARPQLEWGEYLSGKGAIPVGGMVREFYALMRDEGMDHATIKQWMEAIRKLGPKSAGVFAAELEGFPAHESHPHDDD